MPIERKEEVARLLQQRLEAIRQRDGVLSPRRPGRFAPEGDPSPGDARDLDRLRREWRERGRGRSLAEVLGPGARPVGPDLWKVVREEALPLPLGGAEALLRDLEGCLSLVRGVRDRTANRLRQVGIADLEALQGHPRFGADARRVRQHLDCRDLSWLTRRAAGRLGPSSLWMVRLALLAEPSEVCVLDLETGGLFAGSPIVVAGTARLARGAVRVTQWVVSGPEGELALVEALAREMERTGVLMTFNGRSFDWPCLCGRAAYWGCPWPFDPPHLDLLFPARRAFRDRAADGRLSTLAQVVLGRHRPEDLPGAFVPALYQEYLRDPEEAVGLLAAITWHNRLDLLDTVALWARMAGGPKDSQ